MATAFILAAGFGTRLRPLTELRPKPLVPVCGVPLLSYALALCARHGLRDAVVNAHWLAEQVEAWEGEHEGVRVAVSTETPDILGTGGGLKAVQEQLAERFVVLNGDVLHDVDLTALLAAVPAGGGAMALRPDPEHAPVYGVVAADGEGRVARLTSLARAEPVGPVDPTTHFTGIHALDRAALSWVPEGFACIVRTTYVALVPERQVGAIRYTGPWLDAGDPAAYLDANLAVLRGDVTLALDPMVRAGFARWSDGRTAGDASLVEGVTLEGAVWVGSGARVAPGASLRDTVVGEGARVAAAAKLDASVVWSDATVPAGAHHRSIAYGDRVLHP